MYLVVWNVSRKRGGNVVYIEEFRESKTAYARRRKQRVIKKR